MAAEGALKLNVFPSEQQRGFVKLNVLPLKTPDHANLGGEKIERRDVRFSEFQSFPFCKGPPSLPLALSPVGGVARWREGGPLGVPFVCRVVGCASFWM